MNNTAKPSGKGQMLWKADGTTTYRVLYLRHHSFEQWRPYQDFPQYVLPDPPGFSKGYATFVDLLRKGWVAEPLARSQS
jgi:hypothetical protein